MAQHPQHAQHPQRSARPVRPARHTPARHIPARHDRRAPGLLTALPTSPRSLVVGLLLPVVVVSSWVSRGDEPPAAAGAVVARPAGDQPPAAGPDPAPQPPRPAAPEPEPAPEPARAPAAAPAAAPAVMTPTGELVPQPGTTAVAGAGPLTTYRVEVERGVPVDAAAFTAEVDRVLADPRGWTTADGVSLQRVEGDADVVVVLATPQTTDGLCRPLDTAGKYSCWNGERAVINADRWLSGADSWGDDLAGYREYVVNHEVGHGLDHGHTGCPRPGAPAPVMVQQTKGLDGCTAHGWPVPP